ncbi:MAG: helix-turn-helix transcriptional regulator [Clostridiales bacterium]|nr:helix-turn-helix transcriptional regulator [Proteus hauseri]MBS6521263.1 helix-turn-helix transcriptional regulator [Clostridiales bacterium]
MRIGDKLKEQCGLSQQEVAERLHLVRQTVVKWETDKSCLDLENLAALGTLYQIWLDGLLGVEKEEMASEYLEKKAEEEEKPVEEEKSAKKAEVDWKEQGMLFAIALVSCLLPLLGVIVPAVML